MKFKKIAYSYAIGKDMKNMKRKLRQLLSLALVVLMLLSVAPVTTFALQEEVYDYSIEGDTAYYNADDVPDYQRFRFFSLRKTEFDGCFGNQLDTESKRFYDAIVENYVTNRNYGEFTYNLSADCCYVLQYSKSAGDYINQNELDEIYFPIVCSTVFDAHDAFLKDYPEIFWMRSASFSTEYKTAPNIAQQNDPNADIIDVTIYTTITFKPNEIYTDAHNDIEDFDNSVNAVVNELAACFDSLGSEITRKDMLLYMHDYIATNSDYDHESLSDPTDLAAHSAQPFFIGDKLHVCEGYAKVFKILCDRFDIPCVLISGKTKDHNYPDDRTLDGGHMWNYVQMEDGKWYLIDITWDDQSVIYYNYFLANQNTKGFYFDTIAEERYETYTFSKYTVNDEVVVGKEFVYPEFSSEEYVVHIHNYTVIKINPSCTIEGCTIYTCDCGYTYNDNYAGKLPHTEILIPGTDSTCTTAGKTEGKKCSVCGTVTVEPTVKPLLSHNYTASSAVDATCTEDGYTTYTCTECSASYKDNYVKASGHNYEEGTCTKCGESKADNCSHMCHKNNFIWKLLKFFFKLFKIQPVCECGVKHY